MPLGSVEITQSREVMLTVFMLFFFSLFVLVPLTAEEKWGLRSHSTSASKPGALLYVVKHRLQEVFCEEVVGAVLEIGSDVGINRKVYIRKGKLKDKRTSSSMFFSVCKVPCNLRRCIGTISAG